MPTGTDRLSMTPDAPKGPPKKCERWRKFGTALSLALADKTQTAVAKEIGVSTSTLSAWKLGQGEPDRPEITFALEKAVGAEPGQLSVHLGYVPPGAAPVSWQAALIDDPEINDRDREVILAVIRAMRSGA